MSMDLGIDPEYSVTTGPGGSATAQPQSTYQSYSNFPGRLQSDPTFQAYAGQYGLGQADYNYNRNSILADIAYNQALAQIGSGGGGGPNPILDALKLQGNDLDRSYLNYQTTAAQKGLGYQNQTFDLNQQGNELQRALLGLSGQQNKLNMAGLNDQFSQLDLIRALTGLDRQSNDLNKQDVLSAIRTLGLSRQELGLQDQGLQETLAQLGINRGESQASADTQMRNAAYDAIARGATTSQGYLMDRGDIQGHLQRALAQIASQEKQVGYNRQDLGIQGEKLNEQEGGYNRQLQQLGLNDQRYDIKNQQTDYQGRDIQRQLQALGINMKELGIRGQDLDRLNALIGVQRNQANLNTYSDYARINNALGHLDLEDQGINAGGGSGGGSSAVAQQALAGVMKGQANLDALNQRQLQGVQSLTQQILSNPAIAQQILGIGGSSGGGSVLSPPSTSRNTYYPSDPAWWAQRGVAAPVYRSPLGGGGIEY